MRRHSSIPLICWAPCLFRPRHLSRGEVEVWRVSIKHKPPSVGLLSAKERVRAQLMSNIQTKRRFVVARGLLRRVLSTYLKVEPQSIVIDAHANRKPFLPSNTTLRFNVAHAAHAVVIAVSRDINVGVDVELCNRVLSRVEELARRRLSPYEYVCLKEMSGGDEEKMRSLFLELWTRKEAFVKCTGEGIARDLQSFEVSVGPTPYPQIIKVDGSHDRAAQWRMRSIHTTIGEEDVFSSLVTASPRMLELKLIDF